MKNIPFKNGFIYNSMKRHRTKLACNTLIVALVFAIYFVLNSAYILNVVCGASPLDEALFEKEVQTIEFGEELAAKSDASSSIRTYSVKSESYWQGNKYEFGVNFSDVHELPISYTTQNTSDNYADRENKGILSAKLYYAKLGKTNVIVLAYPHQKIKAGEETAGIFTMMPNIIQTDISLLGTFNGENFCKYIFDTRGIEMGSERFDISFILILALLFLYLLAKLCIYFINPYLTPTYRSLQKYGKLEGVVRDIEAQLQIAGIKKIAKNAPVVTDDWIVSEDSFKLKIIRNHTKPQDNSRYGSRF